jgi:hypothetical protein
VNQDSNRDQLTGGAAPLVLGDLALELGGAASNGLFIVSHGPVYCRCGSPYALYHHLSPTWFEGHYSRIAGEKLNHTPAIMHGGSSHHHRCRCLALALGCRRATASRPLTLAWFPSAGDPL